MRRDVTVSTGQAAALCSVTPDTILKWIKKQRIQATKTAGGHYRIHRGSLHPYSAGKQTAVPPKRGSGPNEISCWEFNAPDGKVNDVCKKCVVFKSRAEKCYVVAKLGIDPKHAGYFCESRCEDCRYFQFVNQHRSRILIVTENRDLVTNLRSENSVNIEVQFACCGYEVSTTIQNYCPDSVVIDGSLTKSDADEICRHLRDDSRVRGTRILLATRGKAARSVLPKGVSGTIDVPFSLADLEDTLSADVIPRRGKTESVIPM